MILAKNIIFLALAILSTTTTISGADEGDVPKTSSTTPSSTEPTITSTTERATTVSSTTAETTTKDLTTVIPTTFAPTTSSSTTVAPTTTARPQKENMWIVKDSKTNKTCVIAELKIQLDIPYTNVSNKVVMAHVKVPGNATGSGSCNSSDLSQAQTLVLNWGEVNSTSMVSLTFAANVTSKQFWLESINAVIAVDNKTFPRIRPTVKQVTLVNGTRHFVTPLGNSYDCPILLNIPGQLTPSVVNQTGYFTLDHFQLEAFANSTANGFSSAIYCEGDNTPDLVPILVGCTLVGLVVIVLGVYLWGRRRSQRGYLSM